MRYLLLWIVTWLPLVSQAQLIFSHQIEKNGFSDALNVDEWGENYLIRTSDVTTSPLDFTDYLLFVDESGNVFNRGTLNPYAQESDFTSTEFTVLSDTVAVALSAEARSDNLGQASLIRFDQSGDTLQTREIVITSTSGDLHLYAAGDSVLYLIENSRTGVGLNKIIIKSLTEEFEDISVLELAENNASLFFKAAATGPLGSLYILYTKRDNSLQQRETYHAAKINMDEEVVWERQIANPFRLGFVYQGYIAILPVGNDGVAVLEGLNFPNLACAGPDCESDLGRLRIYPDATSSSEVFDLNFSPFGMELLPGGGLFVYGATSFLGDVGKGVLFNPDSWPDGNRIHILNNPNTSDQEPIAFNSIYGMKVANNGDLVGTGVIGHGSSGNIDRSHWLFRIGANGCFTADCSDLAEDPGNLVPTTNIENDLTIKTHPNPFTSTLNFTAPDSRPNDPVTVSLHDLSGRLLRSGKLEGGLEWATEDLPAGMYVVTFTSGGKRGVVKVVKQ